MLAPDLPFSAKSRSLVFLVLPVFSFSLSLRQAISDDLPLQSSDFGLLLQSLQKCLWPGELQEFSLNSLASFLASLSSFSFNSRDSVLLPLDLNPARRSSASSSKSSKSRAQPLVANQRPPCFANLIAILAGKMCVTICLLQN